MMTPDRWVVLDLTNGLYKLLSGWRGGYLTSSSWRLNSGIVSCKRQGKSLLFTGYSGQEYLCSPKYYGTTPMTENIWDSIKEKVPEAKILPQTTDFVKLFT